MLNDSVPVAVLTELTGISETAVRELARRAIVVKAGHGRYHLAESMKRYCQHLRELAVGHGGAKVASVGAAERARLAKEQADGQALKNAIRRGELLDPGEVEREWSEILRSIRTGILGLPVRLQLPANFSACDIAVIDSEIRDVLIEITGPR